MTTTKDLIERARLGFGTSAGMPTQLLAYRKLCDALANALEHLQAELATGAAIIERLSALASQWNTECDDMREDNKRLAAELATAQEWNEHYAIELRELREQKPAWWHYRVNDAWHNFSKEQPPEDACDDGSIQPLYTRPIPAAQSECTHDCNQGRDCTCRADHIGDTTGMVKLLADIERCYRMLLSEPDANGAAFKAENILREAIADVRGRP